MGLQVKTASCDGFGDSAHTTINWDSAKTGLWNGLDSWIDIWTGFWTDTEINDNHFLTNFAELYGPDRSQSDYHKQTRIQSPLPIKIKI